MSGHALPSQSCPFPWGICIPIKYVVPWVHPTQHPKRHLDRFSRFCTAHGRKSLYFTMSAPFPKIAPSHGGSQHPFNTRFLRPIQAHNPNSISIRSAVFAQMTSVSLYFTMGSPLPPQNCLFPWLDMDSITMHGSYGPPESLIQTASRSAQPFLQGSLV